MAAIQQEFLDCKAYGGTTVLVVPAVVNKKVSYREPMLGRRTTSAS